MIRVDCEVDQRVQVWKEERKEKTGVGPARIREKRTEGSEDAPIMTLIFEGKSLRGGRIAEEEEGSLSSGEYCRRNHKKKRKIHMLSENA